MEVNLLLFISILLLIFIVAMLYASVGHGGASGYIAVLAIFGVANSMIKFSSLFLNILVSSIAFYHYYKAGYFKWKLFFPFAIASVPFAAIGASIDLPDTMYKKILAFFLLFPILKLLINSPDLEAKQQLPIAIALLIGAILGFISGILGIGGGIILSPILLLFHWANLKETAAVSALFILVNSISGFVFAFSRHPPIDWRFGMLVFAALLGGFIGARLGSARWSIGVLKNVLALVLVIATVKLVFA